MECPNTDALNLDGSPLQCNHSVLCLDCGKPKCRHLHFIRDNGRLLPAGIDSLCDFREK
jgi:hypothetical protein